MRADTLVIRDWRPTKATMCQPLPLPLVIRAGSHQQRFFFLDRLRFFLRLRVSAVVVLGNLWGPNVNQSCEHSEGLLSKTNRTVRRAESCTSSFMSNRTAMRLQRVT